MAFRVLGPVEVLAAGQPVDAGKPQQRAVLAALLVDAGRLVTSTTLIDRVWSDTPPAGARRILHVHVVGVRKMLRSAATDGSAPVRLVSDAGGYRLDVDLGQVDLHRFRLEVERARHPALSDERRAALLREATGLWRGEPLAGIGGQWADRMRETWNRERLDATVAWAHAEIAVGNPGAVLGPLSDLAGEQPFVEPLAAALMRALYAAGRVEGALTHYTTIRSRLVDQLGVEPGAELRALHQAILRGNLQASAPAVRLPVPAQLPADVPGFVGRAEYLAGLDALLKSAGHNESTVVISAVSGTAGVGKTALAVHWSHSVAAQFPDGQLYVNLRGFDPDERVVRSDDAVRGLLDALGVPPERMPSTLETRVGLYRSMLAGRRVLIVLDNVRDAAHVRPLLPATPTAFAVVTSRNQLTPLLATDGAHPLTLDLLSTEEAHELLARRLGADRVTAEPDAVGEIITACAGLPLALAVVAARARQNGFSLATLAAELGDARDRLDVLDAGDTATRVRAVLSSSYETLSPPAGRLFRVLGLHPGPDVSTPAAASLAGRSVAEVRTHLGELTRANLLVEHRPGRYTFHDLLRIYATDLTRTVDTDVERRAATIRMLDHYLHTAYVAARLLQNRDPLALAPAAAGVTPERPEDVRQALEWFTAEHPVLVAAVARAADAGLHTRTWQLAWALVPFVSRRGLWHDWATVGRAGVAAADRLADLPALVRAHRDLSFAYVQQGRIDDARSELYRAVELAARAGDRTGQAHTHNSLSYLSSRLGHYAEALDHARQALALHEASGNQVGRGDALNMIGWCQAHLGAYEDALACCRQALALHQEFGDQVPLASTWDSLGYIHHRLGDLGEAVACYGRALALFRDLGDLYQEAATLVNVGDTYLAGGDIAAARTAWHRAADIFTDLHDPEADPVRAKLAGLDPHGDRHPG